MSRPDTIVINAEVFGHPTATSVAVTGERITEISATPIVPATPRGAEVIDAGGATLMPGFIDAHVHPLAAGAQLLTCDLSRLPHSLEPYQRAIREYADSHNDEPWVVGNGWYGDTFPGGLPTAEILDSLVPDRPAVLVSHDGHGVWVNSAALRLAGIDDRTPDPTGGRINRDESGKATGILVERAQDLVTDLRPPVTDEFVERAILEAQAHLHRNGITAWQDALVGELWGLPSPLDFYRRLAADGRLTARVVGALYWVPGDGMAQLENLVELRSSSFVGRFQATSVKVMQDGVCENCTGAMLQPYSGRPDHVTPTGLSFIEPEELKQVVNSLDTNGFQVHMHAVGDRAVRECLDAIEFSRERCPQGQRHQIAHVDVVDSSDVPRFKHLDVIANLQALWARRDKEIVERKLPLLGPEREPQHFPFGDLYRAGARLAMGSDWPVTDPNPLWAIYTAVTRTAPPEDPHAVGEDALSVPLEPHQALPLQTALEAYTMGSAYANGMEAEVGSIELGKLADLVVLDRPILNGEGLSGAEPQLTMVGGKSVHRLI